MSRLLVRAVAVATCSLLAGLVAASSSSAFNYVSDSNGTFWGIQDAAPPRVDTGSIRATQIGAGQSPAYSTTINGYGGIKVWVSSTPAPRFNGELMRGFGLEFDGVDSFRTTRAVPLGGVEITRSIKITKDVPAGRASWGRWLDTFRNTTGAPVTVKVAFGGQTGYSASGSNSSALVMTSSGDATVTASDAWAEVATPLSGTTLVGGPQATVIGTPAPFAGALTFTGNWLHDTFENPLSYGGHEGNFQAYVNTLELAPGEVASLLHFIVLGQRVNTASADAERLEVEATASLLAESPDLDGLTAAEVGSIRNFANLPAGGGTIPRVPAPAPPREVTTSGYDVVEKTIGELQADMESGLTTAQEITRAYLDRIEAYDKGQFGFNAYEIVASDALEQARKADEARAAGRRSPVLGIPIAVKNLFDTYDMATTNGSLTFDGFRPARDAFQVAKLREAGAVIIGKAALEEYATSGNYSNDAWGQVWNAFMPSKSALASSGGSATAVAANLAAGALGSQTGDSLYAPASGASLVTLRGTDGLESGTGIMPLSWLRDFGGVMTRSVSDLADMLNVVAGTDPEDPATAPADANIPDDWRSVLDPDALRGKRIGYIPAVWEDPFGTTNTIEATKAALKYFEQAGATIVEMGATVGEPNTPPTPGPTPPGNISQEGWMQYIDAHPELAEQGFAIRNAVDVACSQRKVAYVRQDPSACEAAPAPRLTAAEIQAHRDYRDAYKQTAKAWLDAAGADDEGVDAVVYPGLLSDISLNDGGGGKASFGRRDTPGAGPGIPTVVFPAGVNDKGQPVNLQLLGRAWDDDELVGMAYAFERLANADGSGHVATPFAPPLEVVDEQEGSVGGTVPATLALTLGAPASFGAFTPGVERTYTASTTAGVVSTAGNAALAVSEPGHLANGAFTLPEPLAVSFSKASWTAPVSNDGVTITFSQRVKAGDPLRTGTYDRTLTFTLSTTSP